MVGTGTSITVSPSNARTEDLSGGVRIFLKLRDELIGQIECPGGCLQKDAVRAAMARQGNKKHMVGEWKAIGSARGEGGVSRMVEKETKNGERKKGRAVFLTSRVVLESEVVLYFYIKIVKRKSESNHRRE